MSVFSIGLTGLNAAHANLVTTGHNIANAATPGFHRQRVELQTNHAQPTGDGFLGTGVDVVTVSRIYSDFLDGQVTAAQGQLEFLQTYLNQVDQINNLLADPNAGLTPAIEAFFNSLHEVAVDPTAPATRQGLLSGAETLTGRLHALEARLSSMFEAANGQIRGTVTNINALAREIATLNRNIMAAEAAGGGHSANDLRDQRDAIIARLNKLTGVTTVSQSDGTINVMIGKGQNLVIGDQALTLSTVVSPEDSKRLEIGYDTGAGVSIITANLTGGSLGALLHFQRNEVEPMLATLGRIAITLAQTFNEQHRLGQDLTGALGGDFFVVPAPNTIARANNNGTGVLAASIVDVGGLTTSDYRVNFNAGSYTVTRLADGASSSFGSLPQTIDGLSIALLSGVPVNGDSFLIQPTRTGARDIDVALTDPAKIAAAAPIRASAGAANLGTGVVSPGEVLGPPPVGPNLQQPVTLTFTDSGTFDVVGAGTGNPTGVAYVAGGTISYNGWSVTISGAPRSGDTFTVGPNSAGVADNRNANLLAGLQTKATVAGGTATYQSAYSQAVAAVGARTREVQVSAAAQRTLVQQAEAAQQALSGVNLDEEAANLIRFQQAYQACGKMIAIASKLFDTLLAI